MLKPYAQSTLTKKYRATGIAKDIIESVKDYIDACANFYYLLEMEEARRIILEHISITEEQLDLLLPLLARDDDLDAYIIPESEFFRDGNDDVYIRQQTAIPRNADHNRGLAVGQNHFAVSRNADSPVNDLQTGIRLDYIHLAPGARINRFIVGCTVIYVKYTINNAIARRRIAIL